MKNTLPLVLLGLGLVLSVKGATVMAENGPHVVFNSIPFGTSSGNGRFQQVYSAALFTDPVNIVSLAFSPNAPGTYSADIAIRLTTTDAAIGALSSTLDDNVDSALTTVFANAAFSQAVTGGSESFSLLFDFSSSPYLYDPSDGNLLLDVLISGKVYGGFGVSRAAGGVVSSRAWDMTGFGNSTDGLGLRTVIGFEETVVPEPASLVLCGIALFSIALVSRRRLRLQR